MESPEHLRVARWPVTHLPSGRRIADGNDGFAVLAFADSFCEMFGREFAEARPESLQSWRAPVAMMAANFGVRL